MKNCHISIFLALTFCFAHMVSAQEQVANWYIVSTHATKTLLAEEKNRLEWEAELEAKTDKTPEEWLLFANLALRSGHHDVFINAMKHFAESQDASTPTAEVAFCDVFSKIEWYTKDKALVRKFAETFPHVELFPLNGLATFFDSREIQEKPDVVLQWVTERYQAWKLYREKQPMTQLTRLTFAISSEMQSTWYNCKIDAIQNAGKLKEYLDTLKNTARNTENDPEISPKMRAETLHEFLSLLILFRNNPPSDMPCDLEWVASCAPSESSELFFVAECLFHLEEYTLSRNFALRALETPIRDDELAPMSLLYSAPLSSEHLKKYYTGNIYHLLTQVAQALNEPEEAQRWMLKEKEFSEINGLSFNYTQAGTVQAFSGQRIVENEILEEEKKPENQISAEYWWKRAEYYQGRGASCEKELEDAYLRVLAFRDASNLRWWSVQGLADLYYSQNRRAEVKELLTRELRETEHELQTRKMVVNYMISENRQGIFDADMPEIWGWLDEQESWDFTEEKLLWKIFKTVNSQNLKELRPDMEPTEPTEPIATLETYYARAEKLVTTPSRAACLGWVLNRMGEYERSLPFLEIGEQSEIESTRNYAAFTHLDALMSLHRWADAVHQFLPASNQLSEDEIHAWLSRLYAGAIADNETEAAEWCARKLENLGLFQ